MLIEAMTMKDFEEEVKKTRTVIIPFGSVEEHGEHLPLGTDTIQAYEIASRVGKKIPVFVCPPVYYGLCRSSGKHPGTISIKGSTLRSLVIDIVESLYSQGLRTFLLFSGHAGGTHLAMILDAAEELLEKFSDISIGVISYLDIADEAWKGELECQKDSHAGESETSLMMVLRSGWIKGTSPEEYPTFLPPVDPGPARNVAVGQLFERSAQGIRSPGLHPGPREKGPHRPALGAGYGATFGFPPRPGTQKRRPSQKPDNTEMTGGGCRR